MAPAGHILSRVRTLVLNSILIAIALTSSLTSAAAPDGFRVFDSIGGMPNQHRVAGRWRSTTNFTVNVNITDGKTHKVTFYLLDYDGQNREQKIEMLDASNNVLASTVAQKFYHGTISGDSAPRDPKYFSFDVSGNVTFKFTNLVSGSDAVVSGVFFDEP